MRRIPATWKKTTARLVQWRLTQKVMGLGIRLFVPRHRIGVSLVAFNDQQEVFLLRHVFHPHTPWGLPGGWMNNGESPDLCLVRELKEETGLDVKVGPIVKVLREPEPDHVIMAFLGSLEAGNIVLSAEILEAAWFAVDQLPDPLYPFTRSAIHCGLALRNNTPAEHWKV